jgi:uncharacterized protein
MEVGCQAAAFMFPGDLDGTRRPVFGVKGMNEARRPETLPELKVVRSVTCLMKPDATMRPRVVISLLLMILLFAVLATRAFAGELEPDPDDLTGSMPQAEASQSDLPVSVWPFRILGEEVPPGSIRRLSWYADEAADGLPEATPVLVAHGSAPGPVLCLTAAIHGDELNGIEMVRELLYDLDADRLSGTIIGVPIVNLYGFRQGERYLPDRRDLNRFFPGNPRGSFASRVAYSFFHSIVAHCDYLVDLHTGSFQRANLTQLRADLNDEGVLHLTRGLGATVVLHGEGSIGTLRRAATDAGIPAVVIEAGEPNRFEPDKVAHGVRALRSLLNHLGMMPRFSLWREPQPTYYSSTWVRAEGHGILSSQVGLGQAVREGTVLGTITDPITSARRTIHSPYAGRVLGMALNQSVRPGYAIYHIGIRKTQGELIEQAPSDELWHDALDDEDPDGRDHAEE